MATAQLTNLGCSNVVATLIFGSDNVVKGCGKDVNVWTPKNVLSTLFTTLKFTFK